MGSLGVIRNKDEEVKEKRNGDKRKRGVPRLWHKCFRRVARLFPAYGTVVLSGRQGSYQCLLVSFTMHDMMIHNACYGHYQCMM